MSNRALEDALLTVDEVAAQFGVHGATVRRWITEGRLKAFRVGPRLLRIRQADLDEFVADDREVS